MEVNKGWCKRTKRLLRITRDNKNVKWDRKQKRQEKVTRQNNTPTRCWYLDPFNLVNASIRTTEIKGKWLHRWREIILSTKRYWQSIAAYSIHSPKRHLGMEININIKRSKHSASESCQFSVQGQIECGGRCIYSVNGASTWKSSTHVVRSSGGSTSLEGFDAYSSTRVVETLLVPASWERAPILWVPCWQPPRA